jgi:hypothetical protein
MEGSLVNGRSKLPRSFLCGHILSCSTADLQRSEEGKIAGSIAAFQEQRPERRDLNECRLSATGSTALNGRDGREAERRLPAPGDVR